MSRCTRLREDMFVAAAQTVAGMVTDADRAAGRVFPAVSRAREIAAQVAKAVAGKGYDAGIATELPKPHDLLQMAQRAMYYPGVGKGWHGRTLHPPPLCTQSIAVIDDAVFLSGRMRRRLYCCVTQSHLSHHALHRDQQSACAAIKLSNEHLRATLDSSQAPQLWNVHRSS